MNRRYTIQVLSTVLLRIEFTASDSLQPMGELLPRLSILTRRWMPRHPMPAVYFCCTFPEVAFGGRYPLFLPCGARTFLMAGLSPPPCDCLSYSRDILQDESPFVNKRTRKSTKIRFQLRLIVLRCLRTRVRRPLERLPEFTPCARRPLSGILFAGETHPRIERSDVI